MQYSHVVLMSHIYPKRMSTGELLGTDMVEPAKDDTETRFPQQKIQSVTILLY